MIVRQLEPQLVRRDKVRHRPTRTHDRRKCDYCLAALTAQRRREAQRAERMLLEFWRGET